MCNISCHFHVQYIMSLVFMCNISCHLYSCAINHVTCIHAQYITSLVFMPNISWHLYSCAIYYVTCIHGQSINDPTRLNLLIPDGHTIEHRTFLPTLSTKNRIFECYLTTWSYMLLGKRTRQVSLCRILYAYEQDIMADVGGVSLGQWQANRGNNPTIRRRHTVVPVINFDNVTFQRLTLSR